MQAGKVLQELRAYVREAGGAVSAFLGGAAVLIAGIVLDGFGISLPRPFTTAAGILLMIWGQFWAYHKQGIRLRELTEQLAGLTSGRLPKLGPGLVFLSEKPSHRIEDERPLRRGVFSSASETPRPPRPKHMARLQLLVQTTISPPRLRVVCDGPIYDGAGSYRDKVANENRGACVAAQANNSAILSFAGETMASGSQISLRVYSPQPVRFTYVEIIKSKPPDPPTTTAAE